MIKGPQRPVNIRILHSGSKAPDKWDSRKRDLLDPCFM